MNQHVSIDHETTVNMTRKGQVLIPKAVRDLTGLVPGQAVRVGTNDRGETVVLPADAVPTETNAQRQERIRAALESVAGSIDLGGMTTDEFMRDMRGDWEP